MIYHITCNTDDNYAQHCIAMLCSLFENNTDLNLCVHILINSLSKETKDYMLQLGSRYHNTVIFHKVDESELNGLQYRKNRPLTKAAYYRILLPDIISMEINRILYLDCDMIVLKSIKELFEIDLDGYALAATEDAAPYSAVHRQQLGLDYNSHAFCSGIMMINLKYWRDNQSLTKLLEFSRKKRNPVYLHDQDALNHVFKHQWFCLPPKFNHTTMSISPLAKREFDNHEYIYDPIIWHYSSELKPWFDVFFPGRKYYIEYLKRSKYHDSQFIKKRFSFKLNAYFKVIRYYTSRYVYPVLPDIIEVLISDLIVCMQLITKAVTNPTNLNHFLLKRWEFKKRQR